MSYLTGEQKTVDITLTFQPGDDISNYTQITAVFYYYDKPSYTPFAYFALVPGTLTPPVGFTIEQMTTNANVITCVIPATLTESLDFSNDSASIFVEVSLGTNSAPNPTAKVPPIDLGKMEETVIGNWLS